MPIITKDEPADNPSGALILFKNLLTQTSGAVGAVLTPTTFDRFPYTVTTITADFELETPVIINSVGIAAHNFGTQNVTVTISIAPTVGGAFTEMASISPSDDSAFLLTFDPTIAGEVRLFAESTNTNLKEIGVMYAGNALQMPRNIYGGHSPITLSQKTEYQSVQSESGQILGRSIIRKGLETAFSWQFLDDQFYRDEFQPFVESARTAPFFIKWRPDFYSEEVAYGETNQDIQPSNMGGGHRLMSVGFTMKAHADL